MVRKVNIFTLGTKIPLFGTRGYQTFLTPRYKYRTSQKCLETIMLLKTYYIAKEMIDDDNFVHKL